MRILFTLAIISLITACSATFSTRVGPFDVPIGSSLDSVCWVQVDASDAPPIRSARYRADVTYDAAVSVTGEVDVQFFGRVDDPGGNCTTPDETSDVPLSDVFPLEQQATQPIEVGGQAYGTELAQLVNQGVFWIGASARNSAAVGEQLHFGEGVISVSF